jgi:hypothetical protein
MKVHTMTAKKDVRILSKETVALASEIMVKSIAGHYVHGLPKNERLDFDIVAEEAVQAACAFEDAVNKERSTNLISARNTHLRAAKLGYSDGAQGKPQSTEVPEALQADYVHGWTRGQEAARNHA